MGFFDGGFSGIAGGLLGIGGSALSGSQARSAADKAWERQVEMAKNKHQWEVEDLKEAGLNPILSATFGGATAPPSPKAEVPDYGKAATSAMQGAQIAKLNAETELVKKQTDVIAPKAKIYGEGSKVLDLLQEKFKGWMSNSDTSASSVPLPLSTKVQNKAGNRSSSAKSIPHIRKGSPIDKAIKFIQKGGPGGLQPIATTTTGSKPLGPPRGKLDSKKSNVILGNMTQSKYDSAIAKIKSNTSLSRVERAKRMQALSRAFYKQNGYLPKVKRR